jgi:hypothetical protein
MNKARRLFNWKAGIYLMVILKGLECSLLVPNQRKNTRPESLQVLEDWHPPDDNYEGS